MRRGPVTTDSRLRALLRAARKAAGNMSQRAAAERAGISAVYWQRIEAGRQPSAPAATLAAMCLATGITADHLKDIGHPDVADALAELADVAAPAISTEDYLAGTPGATTEEVSALQAVWRALRSERTTEPIEQDFTRNARRDDPA